MEVVEAVEDVDTGADPVWVLLFRGVGRGDGWEGCFQSAEDCEVGGVREAMSSVEDKDCGRCWSYE